MSTITRYDVYDTVISRLSIDAGRVWLIDIDAWKGQILAMAGVEAAHRVYQVFGEQIRNRRRALNLTQLELAERIKLTRGSVANIEAGRQSVLLHQFLDIATALKVSPAQLLPVAERAAQKREEFEMPQEIRDIVQKIRLGGARSGPRR